MESIISLEELLESCKKAFEKEFGSVPSIATKAPGRVNIIGEHTDYNDGFVFPMAVPMYSVIVGKPNGSNKIRILTLAEVDSPKKIEFDVPTEAQGLSQGTPKWANYMKGVIQHFPTKPLPGFDACVATSVPLGAGLSSSAALEVATCTFLEALTAKSLPLSDKALLCQKAEHTFANMPCGIMDQFISCMGEKNSALLIDCRSLETTSVPLEGAKPAGTEEIIFLVVNSNVKHQLSGGSEYPKRHADCVEAVKIIGVKSLRDATMTQLREKREELGDRVYRRALHVVSEIERVCKAKEALIEGNYEEMGRIMYQSHVSMRDLYEISCPELDQLVDITMPVPGVFGARMTGGGFGGCIIVLVKASQAQKVIEAIEKNYTQKATMYMFKGVDGASQVSI